MKIQLSHAIGLFFGYSVWEYWLGKTEKLVASSTLELLTFGVKRLLGKEVKMEKVIEEGKVGSVKLSISGGVARIEAKASLASAGAEAGAYVQENAGVLVDLLFAEIEAKSPAGAVPIEESIKTMLKARVMAI